MNVRMVRMNVFYRCCSILAHKTNQIRKKMVHGIQSINQRSFGRIPVTVACVLCCVPICAWLSASICDDWRSTVYDAVSHWSRRQSGIARCVGHFVIGLFSVERTGLQSGHAWLLLYKGHVWRYCFMVRFSQKLQVTLKNKAGKTLGCCDLDGMFVWVVHIVFANRCDASHRAVARHQLKRSCCDDTNNQIPHA